MLAGSSRQAQTFAMMDSTIPDPFADNISENGGSEYQSVDSGDDQTDRTIYSRSELDKGPKILASVPSGLNGYENSATSRALVCINSACFALTACRGSRSYEETLQKLLPDKALQVSASDLTN